MYERYYAILGVEPGADQATIQKAFRRLAFKYHPDVSSEPDAEERFKEINEAYQVLSNLKGRNNESPFNTQRVRHVEEYVAYYLRGYDRYKSRDYEGAIADFDIAIELHPNYAEAYCQRGLAYDKLRYYQQAIADFDVAIRLNPEMPFVYKHRGWSRFRAGDYSGAIEDATQALAQYPTVGAYTLLGNAYSELKDYQQAVDSFTSGIQFNPKDAMLYYNRGCIYSRLKNFEAAVANYTASIELDPEYFSSYLNRSNDYRQMGLYDEALEDCLAGLRLSPDNIRFLNIRGVLYKEQKRYHMALIDYDRMLYLKPDYAIGRHNRGFLYLLLERYADALQEFQQAEYLVAKQSNLPVRVLRLGEINSQEAEENRKYWLAKNNLNESLQIGMALAYHLLGRLELAQQLWKTRLVAFNPQYQDWEWVVKEHEVEAALIASVQQLIASLG